MTQFKRLQEAQGVLHQALELAREHDLPAVELQAYYVLAATGLERGRLSDAVDAVNKGLIIARERGDRANERNLLSQQVPPLVGLGRWDEATSAADGLLGESDIDATAAAALAPPVASGRGYDELMARCREIAEGSLESEYVDARVCSALVLARAALDRGRPAKRSIAPSACSRSGRVDRSSVSSHTRSASRRRLPSPTPARCHGS